MSKTGGQGCAVIGFDHRDLRKLPAGVSFHHGQARAFVHDDFPGANAVQVPCGVFRVGDKSCPTDDGRVVHDDRGGREATAKMAVIHKDERRVGWTMGKKHTWRRHGRPTDVASAVAPADPGRCPFNARNPDPAAGGIISPITVVITSPGPRFVADPIPAAIRPHPITIAVRPPAHDESARSPAAAVGAYRHPGAAGGQGRIEVRAGVYLHRGGYFQIRLCGQFTQTQKHSCSSQYRKVCQFVHKTSPCGRHLAYFYVHKRITNNTAFA